MRTESGSIGVAIWCAVGLAALNSMATAYLNWRGLVELEGIGVHSVLAFGIVFIVSLIFWCISFVSRKGVVNWYLGSAIFWMFNATALLLFVLYPIKFYV